MEDDLIKRVEKLLKQANNMPAIDNRVYKSKDGKYIINEVRIKTIRPTKYYETLAKDEGTDFPYGANKKEGDDFDRSY